MGVVNTLPMDESDEDSIEENQDNCELNVSFIDDELETSRSSSYALTPSRKRKARQQKGSASKCVRTNPAASSKGKRGLTKKTLQAVEEMQKLDLDTLLVSPRPFPTCGGRVWRHSRRKCVLMQRNSRPNQIAPATCSMNCRVISHMTSLAPPLRYRRGGAIRSYD